MSTRTRLPRAVIRRVAALVVLGLALAFGISLGVLLALAKETVRDLVHSRDDLAAIAGRATVIELPFVAAIASRKPRASMVGVSIHDGGGDTAVETAVTTHRVYRYVVDHPEASYSQSMGLLKNTLAVSSPGSKKPHNLVAVVSAREGEGKTATAVHLARYTASTGVRTLLIDCDLRNPRIAEACADVDTRPILDAFENGIDTEALFQSPTYDGLTVITAPEAGTIANPIEFLSSKEMAAFLAHCQDAFDLVILDTAPLGPYLDTRVLVSCADGVIVVAEAAGVSRGELRQALGDAQIDGDMIAAAVLNKCRPV